MNTTTLNPGQRVLVKIGADLIREDRHVSTIQYIGPAFQVENRYIVATIADGLVRVELPCKVLTRTGRASLLVEHKGHRLPVMEQSVRELTGELEMQHG